MEDENDFSAQIVHCSRGNCMTVVQKYLYWFLQPIFQAQWQRTYTFLLRTVAFQKWTRHALNSPASGLN